MDPFSILAATNFGLRALELLLGAGMKAYQLTREASECEEVLWVYHGVLNRCNKSLEDWGTVWSGFAEETYIHFWGQEEFQRIRALLKNVSTLLSSIRGQIEGPDKEEVQDLEASKAPAKSSSVWARLRGGRSDQNPKYSAKDPTSSPKALLSEEDLQDWQVIVHSIHSKASEQVRLRKPDLTYRIGFSLFHSQKLRERLGRLDDLVKQLDDFTNSYFRRMRGVAARPGVHVTREEALNAEKLKKAVDGFNSFTSALHLGYRELGHTAPWSLELRIPDERGSAFLFESTSKIDIDLTLSLNGDGVGNSGLWRRVRVRYQPTLDPSAAAKRLPRHMICSDVTSSPFPALPCTIQPPLQRRSIVLRPLLKEGTFDKPATCKAWEEDRARLIIGLVNWTILMWDSPWTSTPCCCGIRFLQIGKESRQYAFANEKHIDCRNQVLSEHKLLLLGLAMSELLTGSSLRIPSDAPLGKQGSPNASRIFIIEKWQTDPDSPSWHSCSREQILADICEKSSKTGLSKAIEFCLDNPSTPTSTMGSPDTMTKLIDNIWKPVEEFHTVISGQRQKTAYSGWWPAFLARSNAQWPAETMYEKID